MPIQLNQIVYCVCVSFLFGNGSFSGESDELNDSDYFENTSTVDELETTPLETSTTPTFDESFSSQITNNPIEFTTVSTTEMTLPTETTTGTKSH